MTYRILGLSPEPFRSLFGLADAELAAKGARRVVADASFGYPDRVELRDAAAGETLILVNHTHQAADTPYRASHAVFVREGSQAAREFQDEVPESLRRRMLSVRAFDADHMMIDARLVDGAELESAIDDLFADTQTAYLHAHFATRGCYAARIERV
jgi:hypothetical protein